MRKDPTEFRERFNRWKAGDKVYEAGKVLPKYDTGEPEGNPWIPKGTKVNTKNSEPKSAKPTTTYIGDDNQPVETAPVYQEPINPQTGRPYTVYEKDLPLSGTDPIGLMIVEGAALNPVFKGLGWLGKTAYNAVLGRMLGKPSSIEALRLIQNNFFNNKTNWYMPYKRTRFLENPTVGDVIDYGYHSFGGRNRLLSELNVDEIQTIARRMTNDPPMYNDNLGSILVHMDDTGPQPVNIRGLVPKDATNSNSVWNSSLQGDPEIWWSKSSPYYKIEGYPNVESVPRTYIARTGVLQDAGVPVSGDYQVWRTKGIVPFKTIDEAIEPNMFGFFDTIKFHDLGKSIKPKKR